MENETRALTVNTFDDLLNMNANMHDNIRKLTVKYADCKSSIRHTDNETKSSESKQPLEAKMSENSDTECKQTEEVSADTDIYGEEDDEDEEDAILLD